VLVEKAKKLQIDEPRLPRYRKQPKQYDQGSSPHVFAAPKEYFDSCVLRHVI